MDACPDKIADEIGLEKDAFTGDYTDVNDFARRRLLRSMHMAFVGPYKLSDLLYSNMPIICIAYSSAAVDFGTHGPTTISKYRG
jgi:hypothetical protein